MKLIIHIGQPKTGTSAIQGFLNYNRRILADKYKVLYPNLNSEDLALGLLHNHSRFFSKVLNDNDVNGCVKVLQNIYNYSISNNIDTIVLSNESFFNKLWPDFLKKVLANFEFELKIILYLRRQDSFIESAWKQWGHKNQNLTSIHDFVHSRSFDWYPVLEIWYKQFITNSLVIKPYEKSAIGSDIVLDFLGIIGIDSKKGFVVPPKSNLIQNTGLNNDIIEILRLSNRYINSEDDNRLIDFMKKVLPEKYEKEPFKGYNLLSPKDRLDIIARYSESNKKISKLIYNSDTNFFKDPLPDTDENWEPYKGLTLESFVPIVIGILRNQQNEIERLKVRNRPISKLKDSSYQFSEHEIEPSRILKKIKKKNDIKHIELSNDELRIVSAGVDPYIVLSRVIIPKKTIMVRAILTVPDETVVRIYYQTKASKSFSEEKSLSMKVMKGKNEVIFNFAETPIIGDLRIDPGMLEGNYILHNFYCQQG